jgi:hypothetical protein
LSSSEDRGLIGGSAERRAADQVLPWEVLEGVHLIRTLGSPEAGAATVTPAQVTRLRETLPEG